MNEVYLVILEDRHTDVQVEVYQRVEDALERFNKIVKDYGYTPDEPDGPMTGWLANATLSCEGDCVRVKQVKVN